MSLQGKHRYSTNGSPAIASFNAVPEVFKYPRDRSDNYKCYQREAGGSIGTMIGEAGGDCLMYGA